MVRKIGAVVVGILTLGAVVMTLQQVAAQLHPLPEGLDPMDRSNAEAFAAHLETMPPAAWVVAFLSEIVGAFCGALVAGWIARDARRVVSGVIVGLALVGSIANWNSFAHPTWFIAGQIVLYPTVLFLALLLLEKRVPGAAA